MKQPLIIIIVMVNICYKHVLNRWQLTPESGGVQL